MAIIKNNKSVSAVYRGGTPVIAIYRGDKKVFPSGPAPQYNFRGKFTDNSRAADWVVRLNDREVSIADHVNPTTKEFAYDIEIPNYVYSTFDLNSKIERVDAFPVTSKHQNLNYMFRSCESLMSVSVEGWDTSGATKMQEMFAGCSSLNDIAGISDITTDGVTDMKGMFQNCLSLDDLGFLEHWNLEKVQTMAQIFYGCNKITDISINNLNTDSLTNLSNAFSSCLSAQSINLAGWNVENVTNMQYLFQNDTALERIDVSDWNLNPNVDGKGMFLYSTRVNYIRCNTAFRDWCWANASTINLPSAMQQGGSGTWDLTDAKKEYLPNVVYGKFTDDSTSADWWYHANGSSATQTPIENVDPVTKEFTLDLSDATTMSYLFNGNAAIEKVKLRITSQIRAKTVVFSGCSALKELDMSGSDFTGSTSVTTFFNNKCTSLEKVDFSNCDFSSFTKMLAVKDLTNLKSIDFSGSIGFAGTDLSSYFDGLNYLTEIKGINDWDTTNVKNLNYMFYDNHALESVDVSSWNTENVTNMSSAFYNCMSLTEINLSNWKTNSVTSVSKLFDGCDKLERIYLDNFVPTDKLLTSSRMFPTNLKYIRCKQAFKDWCIEKGYLTEDGVTWDLVD